MYIAEENMNIQIGCKYVPGVEELLATLPGANKDIYEDDAEEVLEQIQAADAMKPVSAWKELTVTAVREKDLDLDGVALQCPYLAEKLQEGDRIYASVVTAGKELHRMLTDCDDIMQSYILGFLLSDILTVKTVDVVEEIVVKNAGATHVEMVMAGIPEICPIDQQVQVGKMLADEMEEMGVVVKAGGSLTPTFSSTAFFLLRDTVSDLPSDWSDPEERRAFGARLFMQAGHA